MIGKDELESIIFSLKRRQKYFYPLTESEFKRVAPDLYNNAIKFYLEKRREDSTIIPISKSNLSNKDIRSIIRFCSDKINRKNLFITNYFISASTLKCGNDINLVLNLGIKDIEKRYLVGSLIVVALKSDFEKVKFLFVGGYTSYKKDIQKMIDGIFS